MTPWQKLLPLWLTLGGCDANVVDAVRGPLPVTQPEPEPIPTPRAALETSLIHRYGFDGEGTLVRDEKGAAHGQLLGGTALPGDGTLPLEGLRSAQYVNLPNGIVSGLSDATIEAWVTWRGGGAWQRIFDFGSSSASEDIPGATGTSYLFLTTASGVDGARLQPSSLRVAYSENGVEDEDVCAASAPFPIDVKTHVAVVVDHGAGTLGLYQDGELLRTCPLTRPLAAIADVNDWLGHSNYQADPDFAGIYDEFRIYSAALTAAELLESFVAGPNAGR